jgi:hypothetical protein
MPLAMRRRDALLGNTRILKWMEVPKEQLKGLLRGKESQRGRRALDPVMDTVGELIPSCAFKNGSRANLPAIMPGANPTSIVGMSADTHTGILCNQCGRQMKNPPLPRWFDFRKWARKTFKPRKLRR